MTIEEAIKHCEEVAYQNEILMKRYDDASGYNRSHNENIRTDGAKGCEQLISLYRQLAEWLEELKTYREFADWLVQAVLEEDWEYRSDFNAEVICRKLTKLGKLKVVDNKYMEVNADG
jgi:hypothetical protein